MEAGSSIALVDPSVDESLGCGVDRTPPLSDREGFSDLEGTPPPDAVGLVLEAASLESVFAAQRLIRVDAMHRELREAAGERRVGTSEIVERSIRLELAAAMRITEHAAGQMLGHAEALVHRYPAALDALGGARITQRHAEILVEGLDALMPDKRGPIVAQALRLAEDQPVGTFRRALRRLIDTVQAATLEERHQTALGQRRVVLEKGHDGMATLMLHAPEVELHAIFARATAIGKVITAQADGSRTLDQVRADVLCDLLIDGTTTSTPAEARGIRASVVVTVPALSLLDDATPGVQPALVEGLGPIPLSKARELCGGDAHWMRVLTHPETGMVLSVGRDQYRPPAALRKLTRWRADRCMGPGCSVPASRCEIDHTLAWQDGGATSLDNNAPLCKGHHIVKHHGGWLVEQVDASGGAIRWTSPTGRIYIVQPERRVPIFRPSGPDSTSAPF